MARIDKAWVIVRGIAGTALSGFIGVSFEGGSVVPSGSANADGVVVIPGTIAAGDPVGVLTHGEVVEFGGSAATKYFAGSAGSIGTADGADVTAIGKTIEGDRLVIHL